MKVVDDRSDAQLRSHSVIVYGRDRFMSGWGGARGGDSYAGWACTPHDAEQVRAWVKGRTDIEHIAVHKGARDDTPLEDLVPASCKHFHVYVVDDSHPAVGEE